MGRAPSGWVHSRTSRVSMGLLPGASDPTSEWRRMHPSLHARIKANKLIFYQFLIKFNFHTRKQRRPVVLTPVSFNLYHEPVTLLHHDSLNKPVSFLVESPQWVCGTQRAGARALERSVLTAPNSGQDPEQWAGPSRPGQARALRSRAAQTGTRVGLSGGLLSILRGLGGLHGLESSLWAGEMPLPQWRRKQDTSR